MLFIHVATKYFEYSTQQTITYYKLEVTLPLTTYSYLAVRVFQGVKIRAYSLARGLTLFFSLAFLNCLPGLIVTNDFDFGFDHFGLE